MVPAASNNRAIMSIPHWEGVGTIFSCCTKTNIVSDVVKNPLPFPQKHTVWKGRI